jgi:methane monooxygenase regulatory protein B
MSPGEDREPAGPTMISGPRRRVALGLIKSEEADATIEAMEDLHPGVAVHDHGTYWKLEAEGEIRVAMDDVAERLGRPLRLGQWLVIMATFVGRAHAGGDYFLVTSEMSYLEGPEVAAAGGAGPSGG